MKISIHTNRCIIISKTPHPALAPRNNTSLFRLFPASPGTWHTRACPRCVLLLRVRARLYIGTMPSPPLTMPLTDIAENLTQSSNWEKSLNWLLSQLALSRACQSCTSTFLLNSEQYLTFKLQHIFLVMNGGSTCKSVEYITKNIAKIQFLLFVETRNFKSCYSAGLLVLCWFRNEGRGEVWLGLDPGGSMTWILMRRARGREVMSGAKYKF